MSRLKAFCQSSVTTAFWKQIMLNVSCLNDSTTSVLIENIIYGNDPMSPKFCFNRLCLLTSSGWCFSYSTSANRFCLSFNLLFLCSLFFSISTHGSTVFLLLRTSMHFTSDLRLKNIFKYHTQNYTAPAVFLPLQLANNSLYFFTLNKSVLYSAFWNIHSKQGELF